MMVWERRTAARTRAALALLLAVAAATACDDEAAAPKVDSALHAEAVTISADGFSEGMIFRMTHTVADAIDLTDFQVRVQIDTATEIAAGRMQASCADIRVYAGNGCTAGTPVNFWVADGTCNSAKTDVWLGLPSIAAGSTTSFAIYWGDSGASSASNGSAVFPIFFDDFNDGSIDLTKWNLYNAGILSESGGLLTTAGGASALWTKEKVMAQGATVFGVRTNAQAAGGADIEYGAATLISPSGGAIHWGSRVWTGVLFMAYDYSLAFVGNGGGGTCLNQSPVPNTKWTNNPGDNTFFLTEFFYEWSGETQTQFGIYDKFGAKRQVTMGNASCRPAATESAYYQFDHSSDSPNPSSSLDYAYVRKYARVDPEVQDRTALALAQCLGDGAGPCTPGTASAVCASGKCSPYGSVCLPPAAGSCWVDGDCGDGQFCHQSTFACTTKLAIGSPLPADGLHATCPGAATNAACLSGQCNTVTSTCAAPNGASCSGAGDCITNVCDSDDRCGYASGGSCTPETAGVCRFSCGESGVCLPPYGCDSDSGCGPTLHCDTVTLTCQPDRANGTAIPADHGACGGPAGSAGTPTAVCTSGECNVVTNTCAGLNESACTTSAECVSDVCGSDETCGHPDGAGPCASANAALVCRSEACSATGDVCIPSGAYKCWVDTDCYETEFCHRATFSCLTRLAAGDALPDDALHEHCPSSGLNAACASGLCNGETNTCALANGNDCSAASQCVVNVCDADGACGYANGGGECESDAAAPQCRSGACGSTDICIPVGGCGHDDDCPETHYCVPGSLQCATDLANGYEIPAEHGSCTGPAGTFGTAASACVSGECNVATSTCAGPNTTTTCSTRFECISDRCGSNGQCGAASGEGACTADTASELCQSSTCSVSANVCIPSGPGGCYADADCDEDYYCHRATFTCTAKLDPGAPLPGDGLHDACPLSEVNAACQSGQCNRATSTCATPFGSDCNAAAECISNVCDTDGECGYADGRGPCTVDTQTVVCRSGVCGSTGICIPAGGCGHDSECSGDRHCRAADFACALDLGNGAAIPAEHGACGESGAFGDAVATCESGACNAGTNTCAGSNVTTSCTSAAECVSNVCGQNGKCGYAEGTGSTCTAQTAATVCQSGTCSAEGGTCIPAGESKCWVDGDCSEAAYCNRVSFTCTAPIAAGGLLPDDDLHENCPTNGVTLACATGLCDPANGRCVSVNGASCSAAAECRSGVCGDNGQCGIANGAGPCTAATASTVCQSGSCSEHGGVCVPSDAGSCWVDDDCSEGYCARASFQCAEKLGSGDTLPDDDLHEGCSDDGVNAACATGRCDPATGRCVAENGAGCSDGNACAAAVCGDNGKCGLALGEGPCTPQTASLLCQSGECSAEAGVCVERSVTCDSAEDCASGICGDNGRCGHADGEGPCAADSAQRVCQSGRCNEKSSVCLSGECWSDAECDSGAYCNRAEQRCEARLEPGAELPEDDLHAECSKGRSRACSSGYCEDGRCVERTEAYRLAGGGGCTVGRAGSGGLPAFGSALLAFAFAFGWRRKRR